MKEEEMFDKMGKIILVNKILIRDVDEKLFVSWHDEEIKPRAGWIVGFRWLANGRIIPGYQGRGIFGHDPVPTEFKQSGPRIPCVLVVFWPTMRPVKVRVEMIKKTEKIPYPTRYKWTDRDKESMRRAMENCPRDEKGRFKKLK